jgi:hypothetical protein
MNARKLSVVVLCRDNPEELGDTLASLPMAAGGRSMDLEVLVVDGSFGPECRRRVEAMRRVSGLPHLRWQRLPPRGIYDAMNRSLTMVEGDWLAFMNAGDIYENGGLALLSSHAEALLARNGRERAVAVFGQAWVDPPPGTARPWLTPDPAMVHLNRWMRCMVPCHQAFLFATDFARRHPYPDAGSPLADRQVMRQAVRVAGAACYLPRPVCRFRLGGLSSRNGWKRWLTPWPGLLPRLMRRRASWWARCC